MLLASIPALFLFAPIPARADTISDLAQCEKTVKFKTGDVGGDDVAACMATVGYALDDQRRVDELTRCSDMFAPGIEARCYRKQGAGAVGRTPAPLPADWRSRKIDDLLAQEHLLTDKCRGDGPSKFYTQDICNQRARLTMVLEARGWCLQGQPGESGIEANKIWQACLKEANDGR